MKNDVPEEKKKSKTTIYMKEDVENLLDEVFIKRIRDKNRTDRSTLISEGIRLLYENEFVGDNGQN